MIFGWDYLDRDIYTLNLYHIAENILSSANTYHLPLKLELYELPRNKMRALGEISYPYYPGNEFNTNTKIRFTLAKIVLSLKYDYIPKHIRPFDEKALSKFRSVILSKSKQIKPLEMTESKLKASQFALNEITKKKYSTKAPTYNDIISLCKDIQDTQIYRSRLDKNAYYALAHYLHRYIVSALQEDKAYLEKQFKEVSSIHDAWVINFSDQEKIEGVPFQVEVDIFDTLDDINIPEEITKALSRHLGLLAKEKEAVSEKKEQAFEYIAARKSKVFEILNAELNSINDFITANNTLMGRVSVMKDSWSTHNITPRYTSMVNVFLKFTHADKFERSVERELLSEKNEADFYISGILHPTSINLINDINSKEKATREILEPYIECMQLIYNNVDGILDITQELQSISDLMTLHISCLTPFDKFVEQLNERFHISDFESFKDGTDIYWYIKNSIDQKNAHNVVTDHIMPSSVQAPVIFSVQDMSTGSSDLTEPLLPLVDGDNDISSEKCCWCPWW